MPRSPQPSTPKSALRVPRLTHHKATGQARVRLAGKDHYLGAFGTAEAEERYKQLIAEWLTGRLRSRPVDAGASTTPVSVNVLIFHYREWAKTYYVKRGRPSSGFRGVDDAAPSTVLLVRPQDREPHVECASRELRCLTQAIARNRTRDVPFTGPRLEW